MKNYLTNTLKTGILSTINLAVGLMALYSALVFFLILFVKEKIKNASDPALEAELSYWQEKIQKIPCIVKSLFINDNTENDKKVDVIPDSL